MNYIEEMMKTAGLDDYCTDCRASNMMKPDCENCFTAEKQLELIKLIAATREIQVYAIPYENEGNKYYVGVTDENAHFTCVNRYFTQALAQLTTELMQAGELDKEDVKRKLEK